MMSYGSVPDAIKRLMAFPRTTSTNPFKHTLLAPTQLPHRTLLTGPVILLNGFYVLVSVSYLFLSLGRAVDYAGFTTSF